MTTEELKDAIIRHKICILLPTFNNAGTLNHVITDVLKYTDKIIVVNDGSTDSTCEILQIFNNKIEVISYKDNKGKGGALREGFRHAISMGYDYAITIDTDGQHYASDIPNFVKGIIENPNSIIIGSRDLTNVDINSKSSFANKFSNFWFAVQTGKKLSDTQTGYRAYPLNKLYGLSLLTSRYEAELELLVFAAWNGVKIVSIPIQVYYPPQSERVSHFRPTLDFTRISILNTILCFGAIFYGIPARLISGIKSKIILSKEWKIFTHKQGIRRDASVTIGRLFRSIYGLLFFIFWSLFVFTPYAVLTFGFGKPSQKKRIKLHQKLQSISRYIVNHYPGGRTVYENIKIDDFTTPSLIICNHQSHLDLPLIMATYPNLVFLTNDWVWNNKFFGKIIRHAEFLPVSEGIETLVPKLKSLRDRGYSIVVFPEGTRSEDCRINRFHQGAFHLAQTLDIDVLPMVIHGAGHYLPKKDFMFRKATVTLKALDKVKQTELNDMLLREQASKFRKLIKNEYSNIARTVETAEYFNSLVLYKYAYRGWHIVSRCKSVLLKYSILAPVINEQVKGNIAILNGGYGVFSLWYALVNKEAVIYSFEENIDAFRVASQTANIPSNLHYIHVIWSGDMDIHIDFDKYIVLDGPIETTQTNINVVKLPIES